MLKITCPHCWEAIDIEEPAEAVGEVEFVTDCEVCCRPIKVVVSWPEEGMELEPEVWVEPES